MLSSLSEMPSILTLWSSGTLRSSTEDMQACICVDISDNNLFYLEAIHNFVEVLNEYFHNVCELDLMFNFYKVYSIVDEMFLAGEIRETSQTKVLKQLLMLNSLE